MLYEVITGDVVIAWCQASGVEGGCRPGGPVSYLFPVEGVSGVRRSDTDDFGIDP